MENRFQISSIHIIWIFNMLQRTVQLEFIVTFMWHEDFKKIWLKIKKNIKKTHLWIVNGNVGWILEGQAAGETVEGYVHRLSVGVVEVSVDQLLAARWEPKSSIRVENLLWKNKNFYCFKFPYNVALFFYQLRISAICIIMQWMQIILLHGNYPPPKKKNSFC